MDHITIELLKITLHHTCFKVQNEYPVNNGWVGQVAGLTENMTKPDSLGLGWAGQQWKWYPRGPKHKWAGYVDIDWFTG